MTNLLQKKFKKEIVLQLMKDFSLKNVMAAPKISKVSVGVGLSRSVKGDQNFTSEATNALKLITGQIPKVTQAKKAISGFKIRKGQKVGLTVTMRGNRMWDFIYKLINVVIPRIKDFQGIAPKSLDQMGNLNLGFKEQLVFLEISPEAVNSIFGLQVNITTTAKNKEKGKKLLKLVGFPIID